MLDTESPLLRLNDDAIPYVSPDPKKFWVNGLLDNWHVTVRYGFLGGVTKQDIEDVLAPAGQGNTRIPRAIAISGYDLFSSPYEDEDYVCLVALVDDASLTRLNTALSVLPNVNTFPQYRPHITIGYFERGSVGYVELNSAVSVLGKNFGHKL